MGYGMGRGVEGSGGKGVGRQQAGPGADSNGDIHKGQSRDDPRSALLRDRSGPFSAASQASLGLLSSQAPLGDHACCQSQSCGSLRTDAGAAPSPGLHAHSIWGHQDSNPFP